MKGLIALFIIVINIFVIGFTVYAAGSLSVSVFKNVNGQCGNITYQIEEYVNGDWLCKMEAKR